MILKIWDNRGKTFDRYTIRIRNDYYGMSANPLNPDGFNQYSGSYPDVKEGKHLGKVVKLEDLPRDVRAAIVRRS